MFFFIVLINIEDRASIFEHLMFPFLNKQLKTGLISLSNELLYPFSSIASEWHRIIYVASKKTNVYEERFYLFVTGNACICIQYMLCTTISHVYKTNRLLSLFSYMFGFKIVICFALIFIFQITETSKLRRQALSNHFR